MGFKGSGKSVVGKTLADLLEANFFDLDSLIEEKYTKDNNVEKTFREIFQEVGGDAFREMEQDLLLEFSPEGKTVLSVGGGTLVSPVNCEIVRKLGKVILLDAELDILYDRIMQNGMPAYFDKDNPRESFEKHYTERMEIFDEVADFEIDTTELTIEQVAQGIYEHLLTIN